MAATGDEFVKLQQFKTAMDSKQPDMTGVVKYNGATFSTSESADFINSVLFMDNDAINQIDVDTHGNGAYLVASSEKEATIRVQDVEGNHEVLFGATPSSASFSIDSKAVTSITDSISASPAGNALVTDKAVADYMKSLVATDEEFDTYMGLS